MDKIKDLLKQLGASEDLSNAVVTELTAYDKRTQVKYDEEFKKRLEKAKQVCLEEFESEKKKLARKIEIFLESRVAKIDREAQRQAAIGESESAKTLRLVKRAVDGVPIDGTTQAFQAVKVENKRLRVRLNQILEEGGKFKAEAQRANTIAQKALERNRLLESRKTETVTEENKDLASLKVKSEEPKTTRKVMVESQEPARPKPANTGDPEIMQIASEVDATPAFL